jgi:hypothetical protein
LDDHDLRYPLERRKNIEYNNKRLLEKWVVKIGVGSNIPSIMCNFRILTQGTAS